MTNQKILVTGMSGQIGGIIRSHLGDTCELSGLPHQWKFCARTCPRGSGFRELRKKPRGSCSSRECFDSQASRFAAEAAPTPEALRFKTGFSRFLLAALPRSIQQIGYCISIAVLNAGRAAMRSTYAFKCTMSSETQPSRLLMKQAWPNIMSAAEKSPIK